LVGVFEITVADQLGINAAVSRAVDVFEENPIKKRTDRMARLIDFHGNPRGAGPERDPKAKRQEVTANGYAPKTES
jgi:hypothetical protein